MKQQASESLNCVDCVDSMLKERVVFTVRTNFNVSYSNVNEDGGVHILTFFLFNNKDNFITIYSICVCVCVYSLCIETEVRGKRSWVHVRCTSSQFLSERVHIFGFRLFQISFVGVVCNQSP